ncbi:MAG: ligase-associated DNA damage response endonuclease PdeM [Flavobacterium sp.]
MKIEINNNNFTLHYSGSVFWHEYKILLVSDVHVGKIANFREHGLPIPENFNVLNSVVQKFSPEKIIFLGDLFHGKINKEWSLFADWVVKIGTGVVLVEGGHDIIDSRTYANLNVDVCSRLTVADFLLTHHPAESEGFFNFCGHVHPGVKLKDIGRHPLKLACFLRTRNQLILPAFGDISGKHFIKATEYDTVYAIVMNEVIRVV